MGYTHYWEQQRDYTKPEWNQITASIKAIIKASDVPVSREHDRPDDAPKFSDDAILFNGVGDDGHETFYFMREVAEEPEYRKGEGDFQFCKTAQKPYDEIVVACLIAAEMLGVITWSSDGDDEEHAAGRLLYEITIEECDLVTSSELIEDIIEAFPEFLTDEPVNGGDLVEFIGGVIERYEQNRPRATQ